MVESMPEPAAPPELSPGAPAADAVALALLSELPSADSDTAPAAVRSRQSVVSDLWFAIVRARDRPIAASSPSASPSAFVPADAD